MKRSIPLLSLFVAPLLLAYGVAPAYAAAVVKPTTQIEQIRLRTGELPVVNLTADILYRVLASEISAHRGGYDTASQTLLDLATETSDPRLAKRSFQFSVADRDMARAYRAARLWAMLSPEDPEAVAASLALAASNGQTNGMASALWARIEKADDKKQAILQTAAIVSKMADKRVALEVLDQALHESVRNIPVAHLALADAAWEAQDASRALREAKLALQQEPTSENAAQRVLEYGLKVDPQAAIAETRAYIKKYPGSRKLQLMLASRLLDRHEFDIALSLVDDLRRQAPEDFDLLYTEAEINAKAERYDRAQALLNEYINVETQRRQSLRDDASNAQSNASDARLLLVQIAVKQGRLDDAIAQLDLIDDPAVRFQAQIHKAVLQARAGKLAVARATIEAATTDNPHDQSVAALTLASIYRDAGRTDEATAILIKADRDIPDSAEIKYDLAMLYERQGKVADFETLMRQVIDLAPDNANAYNSLGYTFADQNRNLDEAQDLLERALELEPSNPYILDSVGWYFYRTGDLQAALEYLQRSYAQLPEADVAAHLGEVLWVGGQKDDAKSLWRKALETNPDNEALLATLKRLGVKLK
ncbi:MAG: tetratricopeptide repeat protein [Burkholderiaceae bacterium]|nr:tetratricopeptide repeat protein [Burkholderiaceae bacterium]